MGPAAERSPTSGGDLLKQPLVAAALGDAAAVGFIVHVFPPHKSEEGMKIKGKSRRLEKGSWKTVGRGRAHSGFLRCWTSLELGEGTEYSIKRILSIVCTHYIFCMKVVA